MPLVMPLVMGPVLASCVDEVHNRMGLENTDRLECVVREEEEHYAVDGRNAIGTPVVRPP